MQAKVVNSIDEDGAAVDICSFSQTVYQRMHLFAKLDQIQDVQHPLCDIDPAHTSELQALICFHCIDYCCDLFSITIVKPLSVHSPLTIWKEWIFK